MEGIRFVPTRNHTRDAVCPTTTHGSYNNRSLSGLKSHSILYRPMISVTQWDNYNGVLQHSISVLVRLYRPRSLVQPRFRHLVSDRGCLFNPYFLRGITIDGIEHFFSDLALPRFIISKRARSLLSILTTAIRLDLPPCIKITCKRNATPRPHRGTTIHREFER
jgi:hypothetical protein